MNYILDYGDFEYPVAYEDVLDYAAAIVVLCGGDRDMKNLNDKIRCACGRKLNYRTSPFLTTEKRVCPKCGRVHNVDYDPIDWSRNFKAKNELFSEHENSNEARAKTGI